MERGKNAETLEGGFLESKLGQNEMFCGDLNEKCMADDGSDPNEFSNAELARLFGNEESMVGGVAGYDGIREGSGNDYPDEKVLDDGYFPVFDEELRFSGSDGVQAVKVEESVGKFGETFHCDEPFQDGEVKAPVGKCDDVLHPHEPGSPTKIEVSGNSINLFVEVFGPLDGVSDDNLDDQVECKSGEIDFGQVLSPDENGALSTGDADLSSKYEGKEYVIGEKEHTFDNGDLVWVKTRTGTQSWWPGMVCYPKNAPGDMAASEKKGSCLVKYYGLASFLWCDNADLRPFVEYFEQMSVQSNNRSFYSSVERAVSDIGLRVQSQMTCPCFSKESSGNKENCSLPIQKASEFDVMSLSKFQPATFIAGIRDLARSIRVPGKIELMVMKHRLSPFYRAIGHLELPLQLLRSDVRDENGTNTTEGVNTVEAQDGSVTRTKRRYRKRKNADVLDCKTTSSKEMESRERKKSRYLSYPYVDAIKEQAKEDETQSSGLEGTKKGAKKPFQERHIVSKADDINASSAELLAELSSSAHDCSYINTSKYSDSLKRFYCSFRVFSFLDADIASKVAEADEQTEGSKVSKKSKKQKDEGVVGDKATIAENQNAKENVVRKRGRKKKEHVVQMEGVQVGKESKIPETNLAPGSLENPLAKDKGVDTKTNNESVPVGSVPVGFESVQTPLPNIYQQSSWMISFHQACSSLFKNNKSPQKSVGSIPPNSIPIIPDLNGNHPGFPVHHIPLGVPTTNVVHPLSGQIPVGVPAMNLVNPLPEPKKEGLAPPTINGLPHVDFASASVSSPKDAPPAFGSTPVSNNGAGLPPAFLSTPVSNNGAGLPPAFLSTPLSNNGAGLPPAFRSSPLSNNGVAGAHQFLNGNFTAQPPIPVTMSSYIQQSLHMGSFLASSNPQRKRRRRKEKTASEVPPTPSIPDLNGNVLDTSPSPSPLVTASTPEGGQIPAEGEPQKKKRNSGEPDGGSVLLNFAPGSTPARETLVAAFSRFGLLKKDSEVEVISENSVKMVYERSSYARFAFRSLEKGHAFGETLLDFSLLDCCIPELPKTKKKADLQLHTFVPPTVGTCKNRITAKAGEAPDIAFLRQNVEMMKATLEKAGDSVPPETRATLEREIKAFLDKISSVGGTS